MTSNSIVNNHDDITFSNVYSAILMEDASLKDKLNHFSKNLEAVQVF